MILKIISTILLSIYTLLMLLTAGAFAQEKNNKRRKKFS